MQNPETDGEGDEEVDEDEDAVTDRPDPTLEDASEALACRIVKQSFFKVLYI